MVKCSFCGTEASQYIGLHLIRNDGTIAYFCSSKCRKNALKLKRDRKRVKWTNFYSTEKIKIGVKAEEKKAEARKEEAKKEESKKEKK